MTVQELARRAAFDARSLAGTMVRTSAIETVFDAQRLTLARQALSLAGGNAETLTVEELARRMVPVIRELVQRGAI
jgi:hypothetical protein